MTLTVIPEPAKHQMGIMQVTNLLKVVSFCCVLPLESSKRDRVYKCSGCKAKFDYLSVEPGRVFARRTDRAFLAPTLPISGDPDQIKWWAGKWLRQEVEVEVTP